jgi:ABC-type nitrate/sulfonate/bicarbonate transport system substrate-binding protein
MLRFTPSVQFGGSYVSDADGYYADQDLTVTMTPGGAGVSSTPLLVQGTVDVAYGAPGTTAQANLEGADLVIIGSVYQSSSGALISLPDNPISSLDDLHGKKIGVIASNTSVATFLATNGIDDAEIVPIEGGTAPLLSGAVDAIFGLTTNQGVALQLEGYDPVFLPFAEYGMDSLDMTYTVTRSSLDDPAKRDALVRLLMADIQGWEGAISDSAALADLVVTDFGADLGLDVAQQTAQAEATIPYIRPDGLDRLLSMSDERIQATLATIAADGVQADESLFDTSLLDEAYERLGR